MTTIRNLPFIATVSLLVFAFSGSALAEEEHSVSQVPLAGGADLSMAKFYAGSLDASKVGTFLGKFVCLRCDLPPTPGMMKQCAAAGHRHALSMDDGSMVHPLLPGTQEVLAQINSADLHGKNVKVHGRHYPSTGAILVDQISSTQ